MLSCSSGLFLLKEESEAAGCPIFGDYAWKLIKCCGSRFAILKTNTLELGSRLIEGEGRNGETFGIDDRFLFRTVAPPF